MPGEPRKRLRRPNYANPADICQQSEIVICCRANRPTRPFAAYAVVLTKFPLVELLDISLTNAPATSAIAALVCAICP